MKAEIDKAIDDFVRKWSFTLPELFTMRVDELRDRLHSIVEPPLPPGAIRVDIHHDPPPKGCDGTPHWCGSRRCRN